MIAKTILTSKELRTLSNSNIVQSVRGGISFRNKSSQLSKNSIQSINARGIFSLIARSWHSLTLTQQAEWNQFAIDPLNGFNLYMFSNIFRTNVDLPLLEIPELPTIIPSDVQVTIEFSVVQSILKISVDPPKNEKGFFYVYATPLISTGIGVESRSQRLIFASKVQGKESVDLFDVWSSFFGDVEPIGQSIFIRIIGLNTSFTESTIEFNQSVPNQLI